MKRKRCITVIKVSFPPQVEHKSKRVVGNLIHLTSVSKFKHNLKQILKRYMSVADSMGTPGMCASSSWKKFFHFDGDGVFLGNPGCSETFDKRNRC